MIMSFLMSKSRASHSGQGPFTPPFLLSLSLSLSLSVSVSLCLCPLPLSSPPLSASPHHSKSASNPSRSLLRTHTRTHALFLSLPHGSSRSLPLAASKRQRARGSESTHFNSSKLLQCVRELAAFAMCCSCCNMMQLLQCVAAVAMCCSCCNVLQCVAAVALYCNCCDLLKCLLQCVTVASSLCNLCSGLQ